MVEQPEATLAEQLGLDFVVHAYTLPDAIADGMLYELRPDLWPQLTHGKPIVVTASLYDQLEDLQLLHVWNQYVVWRLNVMPTLPEEDRMFTCEVDGLKIWLLEDGAAFTILQPEEY